MSKASIPASILKPGEERRIQRGHFWLYRNEFANLPELADGDVFDVFTPNRRFVCRAFYQETGGIAARALSRHQDPVDHAWFKQRFDDALRLRERLFPGSRVYRWVHGESDMLPGLVVDRYGTVAAVQTACAFYRSRRDLLADLLLGVEGVETAVFLDADGLECRGTPLEEQRLDVDGVAVSLSLGSAQKTGLFLDQRENWPVIKRFAKGARVLDGYCYHGLWGLHAARGGAASILCVDSSDTALEQARLNADLNQVAAQCAFVKDRVESVLEGDSTFDVIVLDPPAFAKKRGQTRKAMTLYEDINTKAMKSLDRDGILITCSCSHFMPRHDFNEVLKRAARRVSRHVQILEVRGASPDHPVLPMMPETEYLKCVILRVL